jgi:MFS family permease
MLRSANQVPGPTVRDGKYEANIVALMAIGFGLVALDRYIINPLFPVMQKDLGLNYRDLGWISGSLAFTWGIGAVVAGWLSDCFGRKQVLIPAIVVFSLLVASTGLATGLISLLLIRALMGFSEGAYLPTSIVATVEASRPTRIGLNVGLQQMSAPLVGLGLGPLIGIGLLKVLPSWHWVFGVVAIPGFITAFLLWRTMRNDIPAMPVADASRRRQSRRGDWKVLARSSAVLINTVNMVCLLGTLVSLAVFVPSYLTDHLKLSLDDMSKAAAGLGAGSVIGTIVLPMISDRVGRRPVMILGAIVIVGSVFAFGRLGPNVTLLFLTLFAAALGATGNMAINVGPLTGAAVSPALAATATGIVTGLGEIAGGALSVTLIGAAAQARGIEIVPQIAMCTALAALAVTWVWVKEPARQP